MRSTFSGGMSFRRENLSRRWLSRYCARRRWKKKLQRWRYTLKRNSTTSPSLTTYSLPSMRSLPASRALANEPSDDEIVEVHHFGRDEAALEIGVNHARGGRRFVAGADRPGAGFFFAGGQIGAQAEQMIDGANERAHAAAGPRRGRADIPALPLRSDRPARSRSAR